MEIIIIRLSKHNAISDDFIMKDSDHIKNSIPKGIPIVFCECDRYSWYFRNYLLTYNDNVASN